MADSFSRQLRGLQFICQRKITVDGNRESIIALPEGWHSALENARAVNVHIAKIILINKLPEELLNSYVTLQIGGADSGLVLNHQFSEAQISPLCASFWLDSSVANGNAPLHVTSPSHTLIRPAAPIHQLKVSLKRFFPPQPKGNNSDLELDLILHLYLY